ncbi:MAG: transaldolase [Nitrospirales bacterium]
MNPLVQLRTAGQSPWYDYIQRELITSGDLQAMIDQDGLMGVTSNPSIFEKAIGGSADYDEELQRVAAQVTNVKDIYEALAIRDIQAATDVMSVVYESSKGRDGYVSLEVSPDLAFNTDGTIEEALRLWKTVDRANVMIKVPGTPEGLPAVEHLLSQGLNINITLLFSVKVYEDVAWTYIRGLEKFAANGGDVSKIASVASFFVSRIDTMIDTHLDAKLKDETNESKRKTLESLKGQIAIANAKVAYLVYQDIFSGAQFQALKQKGAKVQRLLWASTGTKNPQYPDTYYMDALIGPDTVNTIPAATFNAFRDHGTVKETLTEGVEEAKATMQSLADCGVSMGDVTEMLLKDGARMFGESFDQLMAVISRKRSDFLVPK